MVARILEAVAGFVMLVISEAIMPFSGYLVHMGVHTLSGVSPAGAFGCVAGSIPAYSLGMYGGRPLIGRYGKYVLMSRQDLDLADRWFARHRAEG